MKYSWLEITVVLLLLALCFIAGGMVQKKADLFSDPEKVILGDEIMLMIPENRDDLRKQILKVTAQKAILEQLSKWMEKEER